MYTVAGLTALILYKPPENRFLFPRLYVSIISYLSSAVAFIYWYTLSGMEPPLYAGIGLSFLGTMGLLKGFKRIPIQGGSFDASFLQSPGSSGGLVALVDGRWYNPGLQGRHIVRFERGLCFLEETGKRITWVEPTKIFRTNSVTLRVDTGFWRYGALILRFGSPADADTTEEGLRRFLR